MTHSLHCRMPLIRTADPLYRRAVAMSADGRVALSGSDDKTVRAWDLAGGSCLRTLTGHTDRVSSVALSADATVAVTGSDDQTVRVWVLDWEYEFGADDSCGAAAATHFDRKE
jgi:WD40 repeat protein